MGNDELCGGPFGTSVGVWYRNVWYLRDRGSGRLVPPETFGGPFGTLAFAPRSFSDLRCRYVLETSVLFGPQVPVRFGDVGPFRTFAFA